MPGLLLALWLTAAAFPYRVALPGDGYRFPRDHFEHPDFRTEWWYYTGNLRDANGSHYGFELVFFRQGAREAEKPANQSAWRIDDLYLAHAAVTTISTPGFHSAERLNRAGPGIAGASFARQRIWNGNWQTTWDGERQHLIAIADGFRFDLQLSPVKPFVIHGLNGVSQKAEGAGRASHYVTFPRLRVTGTLNDKRVDGLAWMDHEWFSEQLSPQQAGWDWFSAQFSDGTELMLFNLRRRDGSPDPYSSGTFIDRAGKGHHLAAREFQLQPSSYWTSLKTGTRYPVQWELRVPSLQVAVIVRAGPEDQELIGKLKSVTYWEGAVKYSGSHTGSGYLEMTGYDKPVRF